MPTREDLEYVPVLNLPVDSLHHKIGAISMPAPQQSDIRMPHLHYVQPANLKKHRGDLF